MHIQEVDLRAIMVCVDYSDLLDVTLRLNAHHFSEIMIVTSMSDYSTLDFVRRMSIRIPRLRIFRTDAFYENGADFNKWLALEQALDEFGRHGWICNMDADVVWPSKLPHFQLEQGYLYGPLRRMMRNVALPLPPEKDWQQFELHRNIAEIAGYSQIFHADDPALRQTPWFEINWKHAGGGDSMFQMRWPQNRKVRPPFEVLHIGENGKNWCGRSTQYLNGTFPADAAEKAKRVITYIRGRRGCMDQGIDPYAGEKLQ